MKKLSTLLLLFITISLNACSSEEMEGNEKWQAIKDQMLPQLVPVENKEKIDLLFKPFSKEVDIAYVLDKEDYYEFITIESLAFWDIDQKTLHATALKNLEKLSEDTKIEFASSGEDKKDKYAIIETSDSYAAARILVPWIRKQIAKKVGETAIAATPTRDFLIFWHPEFSLQNSFISQVKKEYTDGGTYKLSPGFLRVTENNIEELILVKNE